MDDPADDDPVLARLAARADAPDRRVDPEGFLAWAAGADPDLDGPVPLSRYLAELRQGRPDLLDAYPQVPGSHVAAYREWAMVFGAAQVPIPPGLVPPPLPDDRPRYLQAGVNLAGFLTAELGVGEVARRLALAFHAAGVPCSTTTFSRTANRTGVVFDADTEARFDTDVVCVNADSWGAFVQQRGPAFFAGRHVVGVWFWETTVFPSMFHSAFAGVDELWVASAHVAEAVRAAAPDGLPVHVVPLPIIAPTVAAVDLRARFGIARDRTLFVTSFDHNSVIERKNPAGAVRAFCDAFAPEEGPVLVVKSINGDQHAGEADALRALAHGRDDVRFVDGYLDAAENVALLAQADAVVSLHRAEGFGFNIADAMALGVPVIATAYSGNLAFTPADHPWSVPATEVPVGPGHFPYAPEACWGEPDLAVASAQMRAIAADPAAARAEAARRAGPLLASHSPARVGTVLRDRIAAARAVRELAAEVARAAARAEAEAAAAAARAPRARAARAKAHASTVLGQISHRGRRKI